LEDRPDSAWSWYQYGDALLGLAQARLNRRSAALQCFLKSLKLRPECARSYYDLACLDALEGRRNAAFDNLTQALSRGFRNVEHMRRDAALRSLRRDARWKTLIQRIGELENANN